LIFKASPIPGLDAAIRLLQSEISEILEREDMRWKQRAKQNWYAHGDINTQFFHSWANQHRKTNSIRSVTDATGRVWRAKKEVSKQFVEFYEMLFSSQQPTGIAACLDNLEPRVSTDMNSKLIRPYTEEEVRFALFQMHPLQSLGPDGYSAGFYQKSWGVVGLNVTRAVLHVLNEGSFDAAINATNVCLIPKVAAPTRVTEYRPISLCNVLYKIVSKVLANRLKLVLPHIMSQEQSAFIPRRLITDNILVAFETLHTMDTQ
jgi:hypothetical protein